MSETNKRGRWLSGAFLQNPVLVQAIGLTPVVAAAVTLRAALWVSAIVALHLGLSELLGAAVLKKVPAWLRAGLIFLLGLAIVCPITWWLDQSDAAEPTALRVFLPLMAVNAVAVIRCERFAVRHTVPEALRDAAANAVGFAVTATLCGFLRELFGYGRVWNIPVSSRLHIRGLWMPFGGFLVLGGLAALLRWSLRILGSRGIARGAEEAMDLVPENRVERLEKSLELQQTGRLPRLTPLELPAYMQEEEPVQPEPVPEPAPAPVPEPEPEPPLAARLTPEEKALLDLQLLELLEDFNKE